MAVINPFSRRKQKLTAKEIEAALNKIRAEYDKYIVTFHKSAALKEEFERRYRNAVIESMDMERFLTAEIAAVKSIYAHQQKLKKEEQSKMEQARRKEERKGQPDFADKVLEKLKQKIVTYPPLKLHKEASYEIEHLYGAIAQFEREYWPPLDRFITENKAWALRGEKRDFDNEIWRFIPSGERGIPSVLEKYCILLDSDAVTLKEINFEAQQCIKAAAFFLNDILWCCKHIMTKGIDGSNIEKNLTFLQNIIIDFRIRDLKNR